MGKIAFVFAGQGAQHSGMGKDYYSANAAAKAVFDRAEALRPGTLAQCFEGSDDVLQETKNTQPDMFVVELAWCLDAGGGRGAANSHGSSA